MQIYDYSIDFLVSLAGKKEESLQRDEAFVFPILYYLLDISMYPIRYHLEGDLTKYRLL
jgi:hypothetical protein